MYHNTLLNSDTRLLSVVCFLKRDRPTPSWACLLLPWTANSLIPRPESKPPESANSRDGFVTLYYETYRKWALSGGLLSGLGRTFQAKTHRIFTSQAARGRRVADGTCNARNKTPQACDSNRDTQGPQTRLPLGSRVLFSFGQFLHVNPSGFWKCTLRAGPRAARRRCGYFSNWDRVPMHHNQKVTARHARGARTGKTCRFGALSVHSRAEKRTNYTGPMSLSGPTLGPYSRATFVTL